MGAVFKVNEGTEHILYGWKVHIVNEGAEHILYRWKVHIVQRETGKKLRHRGFRMCLCTCSKLGAKGSVSPTDEKNARFWKWPSLLGCAPRAWCFPFLASAAEGLYELIYYGDA